MTRRCPTCQQRHAAVTFADGELGALAKKAARGPQPPPARTLALINDAKAKRASAREVLRDTQAECGCAT